MKLSPTLRNRLVRYHELRPCTNAFIDARSPGSDQKENFTIIGPGVAENPHQHVHIAEPHGFNIGAARQPSRCTNSLHSHQTAEVFMIHRGQWKFVWGEHGTDGAVLLGPGDTISIPTSVFRGFENVGTDIGFMFAVLGGDDPGRVHWAPHVIEKARGHGLVLLESGALVDTVLGETVPHGASIVHPSTREEIAYIRVPDEAEMRSNVALRAGLTARATPLSADGARIFPIIGGESPAIEAAHDFGVQLLEIDAGCSTPAYVRDGAEVLLVQSGRLHWTDGADEHTDLGAGDTFTVPAGMRRQLAAIEDSEVFIVSGPNAAPRAAA